MCAFSNFHSLTSTVSLQTFRKVTDMACSLCKLAAVISNFLLKTATIIFSLGLWPRIHGTNGFPCRGVPGLAFVIAALIRHPISLSPRNSPRLSASSATLVPSAPVRRPSTLVVRQSAAPAPSAPVCSSHTSGACLPQPEPRAPVILTVCPPFGAAA